MQGRSFVIEMFSTNRRISIDPSITPKLILNHTFDFLGHIISYPVEYQSQI